MALRLSTGLRNKMLGYQAECSAVLVGTGANVSLVSGGASADTITDTGTSFITQGFRAGQKVTIIGATTPTNDGSFLVTDITAGTLTLGIGDLAGSEALASGGVLVQAHGGSFRDLFMDSIIRIFSGSQPVNADTAESGSLLVEITLDGAAFVAGAEANGLTLDEPSSGTLSKPAAANWQGTGILSGSMGWFRMYSNEVTSGASTTAVRLDGSIAASGSQFIVASTTVVAGATSTINTFVLTLPTK